MTATLTAGNGVRVKPSDNRLLHALPPNSGSGGTENTTRSLQRLVDRQAVLEDDARNHGPTDTLGVMMRLGPEPSVLLMMDACAPRARLARMLQELGMAFVECTVSLDVVRESLGASLILLTDD